MITFDKAERTSKRFRPLGGVVVSKLVDSESFIENFSSKWYRGRVIGPRYWAGNDVIVISSASGCRGVFKLVDSESSTPIY